MKVLDLLKNKQEEVFTTEPNVPIPRIMAKLIEHQISCLPVVDSDGDLIGIISDKDIFRAVYKDPETFTNRTVAELMTTDLIVGVYDDELDYIAGLMTQNRVRHIPIVEGKKIVGLLSVGDIVKARLKDIEVENRYLKQYIDGSYPG